MSQEYEKAFETETRNLSALVEQNRLPLPQFRDDDIQQVVSLLLKRKSVLLVGASGVGKTAIIYGVAKALGEDHRQLRELATSTVMSNTKYLGEWQTKAEHLIAAAKKNRAILYFTDVLNIPSVGRSSNDPSAMLELIAPKVAAGKLCMLGEATPEEYEEMTRNPRLASLFEVVSIRPLEPGQIDALLENRAQEYQLDLPKESRQRLLRICAQFLGQQTGPGPALQLLERIQDYQCQKEAIDEAEGLTPAFVDKVFAIYSGLPLFVVSPTVTKPAADIRDWFRERVIGQDQAIDAMVETITLFKAGLHDPQRPIGSFLFVGPTGVGKTEMAKALTHFLFGSPTRMLRFDMSEFKDYHAFEMLLGSRDNPRNPARLLDPIRAQPFHVILFDEIEKAHPNIWDLLLQLLDEGRLSAPRGGTVDFSNTLFIATSNVGARELSRSQIGFTGHADSHIAPQALEEVFRPEMLNRFQHIITFHGLSKANVQLVAQKELKLILNRDGIVGRNLAIDVGEDLMDAVIEQGYNPHFGARALKREIQQKVVLPIATFLMENAVYPGSVLKLDFPGERTRVRVLETSSSRASRKEAIDDRKLKASGHSLAELKRLQKGAASQLQQLQHAVDVASIRRRLNALDDQRTAVDFWHDPTAAHQCLLESDRIVRVLQRLDRLQDRSEELAQRLAEQPSVQQLKALVSQFEQLQETLRLAHLELVVLGPDGETDALLAINPVGTSSLARDYLFDLYLQWAKSRQLQHRLLCEPLTDEDPILLGVQGAYAFGLLREETGIHRLREGDNHSAARVTVMAWTGDSQEVGYLSHRALKKVGSLGGKIRSRLEVNLQPPILLQNQYSLAENRELAASLAAAWQHQRPSDQIVRRYDLEPFLVRDYLSDTSSGRRDILKPQGFHELLCQRAQIVAQGMAVTAEL